jgi:hypothetical protein
MIRKEKEMADDWHEALYEEEKKVRKLEEERTQFVKVIMDLVHTGSAGLYHGEYVEAWKAACGRAGKFVQQHILGQSDSKTSFRTKKE